MSNSGLDKWEKRLANVPKTVRARVRVAIREGADEIVAAQKRLAPVKSGALKDSIVVSDGAAAPKYSQGFKGNGDPDLSVSITAGNSKVRYAHLVEFGTAPHIVGGKFEGAEHPGTTAHPFFYPGYRTSKKRVRGRIARAVSKGIKEA